MKSVNLDRVRELFGEFDFSKLFIDELHWSRPTGLPTRNVTIDEMTWTAKPVAQLAGVVVLEVTGSNGDIPDAKTRIAIHRDIAKVHYENLLIFVDQDRIRSEWFWIKRENAKELPRPHPFVRGQQGDLFLGKIGPLFFDEHDFASGDPSVVEVARRLRLGLDVEKVTKKFYKEFQEQHLQFIELISGIADDRERRWYASVLLNRLMFIWFLQRKGFVDGGNLDYLQVKIEESRGRGKDRYFRDFLRLLFFEGFAKPEADRSPEARERLGNIRYLNGGLFLPHAIEQSNAGIDLPDRAFENLFTLFRGYTWNLNDTPGSDSDEINPDVLGYIFEKYINQKAFGAYYTRPEITTYLCERTIHRLILDAVNTPEELKKTGLAPKVYAFKSIGDLILGLDNFVCRRLLYEVLPKLSILDPACGSGAFLVAAMKTLMNVYGALTGFARLNGDADLKRRMRAIEKDHPSINYYIKKSIITNNLYGVDIMEEAVEIARLRLFLTLVSSAHSVDDLEPLPNIDFNLLAGNSAIGLLRVDEQQFNDQAAMFRQRGRDILSMGRSYREIVNEKELKVRTYRDASSYATDLSSLRDGIEALRSQARASLDDILLEQFRTLRVNYERATWDDRKQREGKGVKRPLTIDDIRDLEPFHWGYEFDEIVNRRGGFDAIITNPPWEAVEPKAKEFFVVAKNATDIKDFEAELNKRLRDEKTKEEWLGYLSRFNHQREFFRRAPEYENQIPVIDGKRQGKDINLYKLFIERCHRLLRDGGECGIVVPSGIYSDLGAKRLRELLFSTTEITGLFGFENRRQIFEGVDSRFKFVVLTFRRGGSTDEFPAAFMRHDVGELDRFPYEGSLPVAVEFIKRMSPDSLSLSEFTSPMDVAIAEKMLRFPLLGQDVPGAWKVELHREFNMTDDAYLFQKEAKAGLVPLYEGKMIHQFDAFYSEPRFYVKESEGRKAIVKSIGNTYEVLDYQRYRFAYRSVASSTNERSMIAAILPSNTFAGHSLNLCCSLKQQEMLYLAAFANSFVFDWFLRLKVAANLTMFYIMQMPVPRLRQGDWTFDQLVSRAARLICTRSEFDELARELGIEPDLSREAAERGCIRAEIDAIVAHAYGLKDEELHHIVDTFRLVPEGTRSLVIDTFRNWKPPSDDPLIQLIEGGESARTEFKSTARWDLKLLQVNKTLEHVIVKTIASFMNSEGGTLLIGVADSGEILGLAQDFQTLGSKANADAYENWLMTRLLEAIDRDRIRLLRVSFQTIEGKTVCRVDVERSSRPVYVAEPNAGEKFWVRMGNSTRDLSISEAHAYVDEHFKATVVQVVPVTPGMATDVAPAKPEAQARLPIQATTESRKVDLSGHGLFRKQDTVKPAPTRAKPEAEVEDDEDHASPRRRLTDEFEVEDALAIIRDVVCGAEPMPREEAIKDIATQLGAERVGTRIRDFIEGALITASRRFVIETRDGGLIASTRSIDDYHRDFIKTVLKAVIRRTWTDEDDAIRDGTRYLGFRRTGPKISKAFKSAINGLLRQDELERDGRLLRRPSQ